MNYNVNDIILFGSQSKYKHSTGIIRFQVGVIYTIFVPSLDVIVYAYAHEFKLFRKADKVTKPESSFETFRFEKQGNMQQGIYIGVTTNEKGKSFIIGRTKHQMQISDTVFCTEGLKELHRAIGEILSYYKEQ